MNEKTLSERDIKLFNYIETLMDKTFNSNIKSQFKEYYANEKALDNGIFKYPISVGRK